MNRTEASPLGYDRLDGSQKEGFKRITEALQDAVRSLNDKGPEPKPSSPWNPWTPVRDKKSNVLFLSGERGTGKTTLMLSVLAHFLGQESFKFSSNGEFGALEPERDRQVSKLREQVRELSDRILWLAPIDMEPLPQPTNLFAAVLARIEHALDHQIGDAEDESCGSPNGDRFPGILDNPRSQRSYRDCLKPLRMLQRNVATAWNGNLDKRAGNLDSDEYFHDVVRSERARVGLPEGLDDILDQLAREAPWRGCLKNPLFILPIDDIDLNPTHAVDLLNLLRTVSGKRLFPLVLGDIRLMEHVLEYKIVGAFSELLGGVRKEDARLFDEARRAASDGIRKLIPPGQRVHLTKLSVSEAIDFKPFDEDQLLRELLEEHLICLHPVQAVAKGTAVPEATYRDLAAPLLGLLASSLVRRSVPLESSLHTRFLGLRLLSATPRFLADLSLGLQEILKQKPDKNGSPTADQEEFKDWLGRSHRNIVAMVARRFLETASSEQERAAVWQHEPERWCLDRSAFQWRMTKTERRLVRRDDFRLKVPKLNEAQVFVKTGQEEAPDIKLNGDCASSLSLLHDLLALQLTRDEEMLSSVVGDRDPLFSDKERMWATVQWNETAIEVNWRLPDWLSVGEYSLFVDYWMSAHARIVGSDPEIQHGYFLFAWVAGATNVLAIPLYEKDKTVPFDGDKKAELVELPNYPTSVSQLPWDKLLLLLTAVFQHAAKNKDNWALSEFVRIVGDWAADLAMILAPEAGTPKDIASEFFEDKELKKVWLTTECCETVRRRRAELFRDGGCDPRMLGLVSPTAAFEAIRRHAVDQDAQRRAIEEPNSENESLHKDRVGKVETKWENSNQLEAVQELDDFFKQLVGKTQPTSALQPAADCVAGLRIAAKHNPAYNKLKMNGVCAGLSPTDIYLRRYGSCPPEPSSK